MLCSDPFIKAGEAFPCGKCLPCRNRQRNIWTHRLMLESQLHSESAFVTLTYADDKLPADMSLQPVHIRDFLKKLRSFTDYHTKKRLASLKVGVAERDREIRRARIRYFAAGEYSPLSRPHYHLVLFGYKTCLHGSSMYSKVRDKCCSQCENIRELWGLGNVFLGSVTPASCGYTVGYIVKNMMRRDDPRLGMREPEFSRKSLKPGLGFGALDEVTQTLMRYSLDQGEAPTSLRHGGRPKPLGRYLRGKLADMLGMERLGRDEEMQILSAFAFDNTPKYQKTKEYFKELLVRSGEQKVLNMEARQKLTRKGVL